MVEVVINKTNSKDEERFQPIKSALLNYMIIKGILFCHFVMNSNSLLRFISNVIIRNFNGIVVFNKQIEFAIKFQIASLVRNSALNLFSPCSISGNICYLCLSITLFFLDKHLTKTKSTSEPVTLNSNLSISMLEHSVYSNQKF